LRQLTRDDGIYFDPDWSPDGEAILCASSAGKPLMGANPGGTNLFLINARTGAKTAVTTGAGDKFMPTWSPNGKWIAYRGGAHFGTWHVILVSLDGSIRKVLPPVDRYVSDFGWMPDSDSIALNYRDGVTDSIARVDVRTNAMRVLSGVEPAARSGLTVSRSGSLAWQESGPSSVGVIRILAPEQGVAQVLADLNPQIKTWDLGDQEVVRWKNRRGEELEGVLIKPPGDRARPPYPLIVDAYPFQQNDFKGLLGGNQALASRGYAVFWPDAPAPHVWMNGFTSEAYSQSAKGPLGWDVTTDDLLSGVDELIRRGIADPDRMCLYGFSNGGGVVNYIVTRTSRFRCAVSVGGAVSDWLRPAVLETESSMPDFEGGDDPWTDPGPYIQISAVFHLKDVSTPMLLADGDDDDDFLLNTIEMYNGLRHFGKDVTLLRYRGQGHGFTGAALEDFWGRENAFFDRYLKSSASTANGAPVH